MTTEAEIVAGTALQTAVAMAPGIAAADPRAAAILTATSLGLQLLQAAAKAQQAGVIPPEQLAALFASVGSGVQSAHSQWQAMNAADAAKAGAQ